MQDIGDNMDELFQKAAKDYPLRKAADNWEEIAPLLKNATPGKAVVKKNNGIRGNNALLILLIIVFIFSALATKDGLNLLSSGQYPGKKNEKLTGNEKIMNVPATGISAIYQKKAGQKILQANPATNIPGYYNIVNDRSSGGLRSKSNNDRPLFTHSVSEKSTKTTGAFADEKSLQEGQSKGNLSDENTIVNQPDSASDITPEALSSDFSKTAQLINRKNIPGDKQVILTKQQRGIYFGFVTGPSFNQVKNQGLNKSGYDIGLVAGYQLNGKLSIESGLLFEKKYYFSDGKYFDMSKAGSGMPAGMQVLSLEGSCAIFEIPFKLKYDFAGNNYTRFFATTGISTYIVTNEYNKYRAIISGTQQDVTGDYNNNLNFFAAAVHLSGGYQRKIGKLVRLRIEPYLQIPIRGIGVGSLSVLSTGIHLGMTIPVIR
ncbi:MAG: outer membrane beta-barrel protein [Chitinophagaceae bacterium]